MPTTQDMNNLLKGLHARDGALVEKLNMFCFLANLIQFNGNLMISYNSNFFLLKGVKWRGGVLVMSPVCQPLMI